MEDLAPRQGISWTARLAVDAALPAPHPGRPPARGTGQPSARAGRLSATVPPAAPPATPAQRQFAMVAVHRRRLVALASSRGAGIDAEDVAHEVLLRLACREELDPEAAWPYAARTCVNLTTDMHRRAARDQALRERVTPGTGHRSLEEDIADRDLATRALQRLAVTESPTTVRLAVRYIADGASWEELGREFGLSPSAARSRVDRAFRRLRDWFDRRRRRHG